jgi:glutamine synthetase type III
MALHCVCCCRYECAPYFGIASNQIEENLMVMQLIEEVATKHGLVGTR